MKVLHFDGLWIVEDFEDYIKKHITVPYGIKKIGTDYILRYTGSNKGLYFLLNGDVYEVRGIDKECDTMDSQGNDYMSVEAWNYFDSMN